MFIKHKLALILTLCVVKGLATANNGPRKMYWHANVDLQRSDLAVNLRENRHLGSDVVPDDYIVRVQRYGNPSIFQDLKNVAAGGFVRYIPHDSYLIALFRGQIDTVLSIPGVEGVYNVPSESKISPREHAANHTHGRPQNVRNPSAQTHSPHMGGGPRVVTGPPPDHGNGNRRTLTAVTIDCLIAITQVTAPGFATVLPEWKIALQHETVGGGSTQVEWPSWEKLVVTTDAVREDAVMAWLSRQTLVFWLGERPEFTFKNGYAAKAIQSTDGLSTSIWEKGLTGENEIIGCADTGLDYDGCHFNDPDQTVVPCSGLGFVEGCTNMNHRKVVSYRYFEDYSDAKDTRWGHGTHVAGSLAGNAGWPAPGVTTYNGAAPNAKLSFDDISDDGVSLWPTNDLNAQLFPHSYTIGARIHSNSWGSDTAQYTSTSKEIDEFIFEQDDFLVLVAAGNAGENGLGTVGSPATAKNCLAVGAGQNTKESYGSDAADKGMNNLVDFSSRGPTSDGRFKPDVICPGDSIFSAWSDGEVNSGDQCYVGGMSGTSMATPLCAGSAALVRQYFKEGFYTAGQRLLSEGFEPSAALVKAMMIHSGQKMWYQNQAGDWRWPDALPILELGYGRVDLSKVLWFGEESDFQLRVLDRENVNPQQTRVFAFMVTDSASSPEFKVTLVWTDYPGTPYASRALVQNLDLTVTDPLGTVRSGNGFVDDLNNNEQITIVNPVAGTYTVKVLGYDLPVGKQDFTLVVTGALDAGKEPPAPTDPPTTAPETTAAPTAAPTSSSSTTAAPTTSSSTTETPSTSSSAMEAPTTSSFTTAAPTTSEAPTTTSSTTAAPTTSSTPSTSSPSSTTAGGPTSTSSAPTSTAGQAPESTTQDQTTEEPDAPTTTAEDTTAAPEAPTSTPVPTTASECSWTNAGASPFSGSLDSFSMSVASGRTRVEFTSDATNTRPGVLAMYGPDSDPVESTCLTTGTLRGAFGAVSDGATNYLNNANCQWVIAPEGATAVTLVFESFDLERNYDYLKIYKCKTEVCSSNDRITLGSYTGSVLPDMHQSDAAYPYIMLHLETDYSVTQAGFRALYAGSAVAGCAPEGVQITAAVGFIQESAGAYSNSQHCTWDFGEVETTGLRLTFLDFDTEANKDFLSVKTCTTAGGPPVTTTQQAPEDPPQSTTAVPPAPLTTPGPEGDECTVFNAILGSPFSGTGSSQPPIVTANSIRVEFASDGSIVRPGFLAMYRPSADPPAYTCAQTGRLTGAWGEISDGPGEYLNNQVCEWIIESPPGSGVTLHFESFSIEDGYDMLHIDKCDDHACSNPQPLENSPFTGTSSPGLIFSDTAFLRIKMVTDFSVTKDGFKLTYTTSPISECQPDAVLANEAGFIRERAGNYVNNMQCSWEIQGSGSQIQLEFIEFSTEAGWDFVDIETCDSGTRRSGASRESHDADEARKEKIRLARLANPKQAQDSSGSNSKSKKLELKPAVEVASASAGKGRLGDQEKQERAARVRTNVMQMKAVLP